MFLEQSEEEKEKQLAAQQDSVTDPSIGAGGGAEVQPSTLGATPVSSSRLSPTTQSTPQNFGTIQDYFKGSKQQGERFGEQFTGKLGETQQQQRGQIGQAALGTAQDISAGTTAFDQGLVSTALADPTKVAGDEAQFNKFLDQWNAAYKGPESFEGSTQYSQAAKAAQDAQSKATQLGTTGGRQQLIQDEYGVYGQGKKGLDEALLQQSSYFPETQEQAKGFNTLQDYLKQQSTDLASQAQAARQKTAATRQQTQGAFDTSLTDFQKNINKKVADQTGLAQSKIEQYQKNLAAGDVTKVQTDLKEAGVPEGEAKAIIDSLSALQTNYQSSPDIASSYFSNPNVAVNPATAASKEDFARAAALQKLTGQSYAGVLNPANIEQAGTASTPGIQSTDLSSYLKQSLGARDKSLFSGQPDLKTLLPDMGDRQRGSMLAQRYIDAAARQGIKPTGPTQLPKPMKTLSDQARTSVLAASNTAMRDLAQQGINPRSGQIFFDRMQAHPAVQAASGAREILDRFVQWGK